MTQTEKRILYKKRIVHSMGGKCQFCGYNKYEGALELHHINPEEKNFGISDKTYFAWSQLEDELKKCVLVCSNCHREIHANLIKVTKSSFVKEIYDYYKNDIEEKKKIHKNYCLDCKKELYDNRAKRCPACAAKERRVCERPNREQLKEEIRIYTFTALGEKYGVSDNAVKKWCDNYNLPRTKREIKQYSDEQWSKI